MMKYVLAAVAALGLLYDVPEAKACPGCGGLASVGFYRLRAHYRVRPAVNVSVVAPAVSTIAPLPPPVVQQEVIQQSTVQQQTTVIQPPPQQIQRKVIEYVPQERIITETIQPPPQTVTTTMYTAPAVQYYSAPAAVQYQSYAAYAAPLGLLNIQIGGGYRTLRYRSGLLGDRLVIR